jgi:hypothetical protein
VNLQRLLDSILKKGAIPPSRIQPVKSSLRKYASILGYTNLVSCPESAYNIPQYQRRQLIEEKAMRVLKSTSGRTMLSTNSLDNIKYDVGFVLREGMRLGFIPALYGAANENPTAAAPIYKYSGSHIEFGRGETINLPKMAIPEDDLPKPLRNELNRYYDWATNEFEPGRPRSRKRRPISAKFDRELLRRIAGFHVKYCNVPLVALSLDSLTDADKAIKYINFFIEHHGRATETLKNVLISIESLAKYLMLTASSKRQRNTMAEAACRIKAIIDQLDFVVVRDKKKCWLSLEQIDACGINRYPRNVARLGVVSDDVRRKLQTLNTKGHHSNLKTTAVHALESLLVRLMVQIPLRLRNYCEMSWNPHNPEEGKNLFRENGAWYIRFSGSELKIGNRRGKINSIKHLVPPELTWLLEEVLTVWRPIITGVPYHFPEGDEGETWNYKEPPQTKAPAYKKAPHDVLLFLTKSCKPGSRDAIRFWVKSTTYAYTKVALYPHLIRHIWATTYIKETGDYHGAAQRLGDTVETVLKHYAHLRDDEGEAKADSFNRRKFFGEEQSKRGKEAIAHSESKDAANLIIYDKRRHAQTSHTDLQQ